jgi:hypothetical protein
LPAQPWRRLDALERGIFAPLGRFVLHAPPANLPAEAERGKLTTALNAFCH